MVAGAVVVVAGTVVVVDGVVVVVGAVVEGDDDVVGVVVRAGGAVVLVVGGGAAVVVVVERGALGAVLGAALGTTAKVGDDGSTARYPSSPTIPMTEPVMRSDARFIAVSYSVGGRGGEDPWLEAERLKVKAVGASPETPRGRDDDAREVVWSADVHVSVV